jgi:hypothetical protein
MPPTTRIGARKVAVMLFKFNLKHMDEEELNGNFAKPVLAAVKIGRKEYSVKKGDYIIYNGICYQFCSGDGRTLKLERYIQYTNLRLPDTMVKKIPFDLMEKQNYKSSGVDLVRWVF